MSEQTLSFDVVIAGAGPAGATLALALAKAGLSVAIVDAETLDTRLAPQFDGRAWAIAWGNVLQLKALGVADTLEPDAQPVSRILVTEGPEPAAGAGPARPVFLEFNSADISDEISHKGSGAPLAWMVENRRLRAALNSALEAAGVQAFTPVRVTGLETDARSARLTLADGRVLEAALAVAADGKNSRLRQAAGIGVHGWDYGQSGVVATVDLDRPHEGVAHEYFMAGSALAALPLTNQRASLVWVEPTDRAKALVEASPEAFEAHLNRRFGEGLGHARLNGARFSYPLSLKSADAMTGDRLALIGDAAHAVHPIAGQGLNLGFKDVAALAEVVVDARRIGEDIGSGLVLDRYARWRRFDSAAFAVATDGFVRAYGSDNPLLKAARGLVVGAMNRSKPLKRAMMLNAGGLLGDTPKLLRGETL
jgi:2-octaprenyl-6-methoxyphenol hydroxylase